MSTTALFIRTFARDLDWFRYCVRGVLRQCRGFDEIVVHTDTREAALFAPHVPMGWKQVYSRPWTPAGYVNQQIVKVHADTWCQSEHICFLDSDCIAHQALRPEHLCRDGRLMILFGRWTAPSVIADGATVWRAPMESVLGPPVEAEFMRRFTLSFRRDTLRKFRAWIQTTKRVDAATYLAAVRKLSEFNLLGAWAWRHQHDAYCWLDVERDFDRLPELRVTQLWSHSRCTALDRLIVEELLER